MYVIDLTVENFYFLYMIKIELRSFKSSEHINERRDGPYHGFGYLSLFSEARFGEMGPKGNTVIVQLSTG